MCSAEKFIQIYNSREKKISTSIRISKNWSQNSWSKCHGAKKKFIYLILAKLDLPTFVRNQQMIIAWEMSIYFIFCQLICHATAHYPLNEKQSLFVKTNLPHLRNFVAASFALFRTKDSSHYFSTSIYYSHILFQYF